MDTEFGRYAFAVALTAIILAPFVFGQFFEIRRKKVPEKPKPFYQYLECDCPHDLPCPQGRDPVKHPRCKVPIEIVPPRK